MKKVSSAISAIVLVGSLVGSAYAVDNNVPSSESSDNYCHLKFPAIRPRSLASAEPQTKSSTSGDVIDYYGRCDESPTSQDQVISQKHDEEFSFGRNYEDGD
ncbi:MAG TPA: hypothetical protein VFQ78_12620 [Candidatus Udaeobacter sp.]|jgi:hypothetical protein|nr:hypothetical protein [Candidatus Udaeobacter sp.]